MDSVLSGQNSPYSVSELLDLLRSIDYLVYYQLLFLGAYDQVRAGNILSQVR
jgi:hypothetical protein